MNAEISIEIAMVTANCWKSVPVMPGSNTEGKNTAANIRMQIRYSWQPTLTARERLFPGISLRLSEFLWKRLSESASMRSPKRL